MVRIENNLCIKAYKLLKKTFHNLPAIKMAFAQSNSNGAGLGEAARCSFYFKVIE
jgi:hypothetical protein